MRSTFINPFIRSRESRHNYSAIESYVIRSFHPRSIMVNGVGLIWFTYYFWSHDWSTALWFLVVCRTLSFLSTINLDVQKFSQTILGKLALLNLNPVNLTSQLLGIGISFYGVWQHSTEMILGGVSFILIGHTCDWVKVDSRLGEELEIE